MYDSGIAAITTSFQVCEFATAYNVSLVQVSWCKRIDMTILFALSILLATSDHRQIYFLV